MKISVLMENTASSEKYLCRHGLSFYIETRKHKILFDMGPDGDFLQNAEKMNIDLSQVDIAFLSHGHYDHGGGLKAFLEVNQKAKIHMQKGVFENYFAHDTNPERIRYIGLDKSLKGNQRLVLHDGDYRIDEELEVFAGVTGRICASPANDSLFVESEGQQILDSFQHEQNLLIHQDGKNVLICGCSHNGMVNILNRAEQIIGKSADWAVGGLHLKGMYEEDPRSAELFFEKLADCLMEKPCVYYTCHCTGRAAYEYMKEKMGEQIHYLASGDVAVL